MKSDEHAFVVKPFEEVQLRVLSEGLSSSDSGTLPKETPTEKGTG